MRGRSTEGEGNSVRVCHPDRVVLCVCAGTSSTGGSQPWRKGPAMQEAVAGGRFLQARFPFSSEDARWPSPSCLRSGLNAMAGLSGPLEVGGSGKGLRWGEH